MAEYAVTLAIQKLVLFLRQEVDFAENIREDVKYMIDEFKSAQVLLQDADHRSETDGAVKEWVTQLRHVAFEVEDLINEYVFQHHKQQPPVQGHGTCRSIRRIKQLFNKHLMMRRPAFAVRIQNIIVRIENISEGKERYNFAVKQDTTTVDVADYLRQYGEVYPYFRDDVGQPVVGIDGPKEQLIRWLVEEPDPSVGVVSVFGMGGLGKSTLVKKVQESPEVREHFDIVGWATVTFSDAQVVVRDLILSILKVEKNLSYELQHVAAHRLKEELRRQLQSKRYFIVIDDIWNLDTWEGVKSAFPDSKCGSRIIVTTRFQYIATAVVENSGYLYEHKLLSPEDSWALFDQVAFSRLGHDRHEHPREVILKFLNKCGGLPLAIVSLAAYLSSGERIELDAIDEMMVQNPNNLYITFLFSYIDLPYHLKFCILYLCLFPEDYVIKCSRLLRLWAAEGFFDPQRRFDIAMTEEDVATTKEDVAKHYLDELIARSLILVQDIDSCGRVRTCRIHSLFREFILKIARDHDFAEFSSDMEPENHRIRRLSISNENVDKNIFPKNIRLLFQIQSLFAYGKSSLLDSSTISLFLGGGVKLMKVLDLEGVHLKEFPGEVLTNLYFLRYLGINSETFSLPSSLGRLVNLETLVLKGPLLFQLPYEILQLKCLRNLLGDLLELPKGICEMTTLEKLNLVVGYDGIDKELGKLTRLRSLCMVCVMKDDKSFALSSLQEMVHLRSLYLRLSKPKDNVLDVHSLSHFPRLLERLTLVGVMNGIPRQIPSLENLTELKLSYSGVQDYAFFKYLQELSKLVELVLEMDAIDVAELHFRKGGFSKLVTLELHGLNKLELIRIEERTMPCIQNIRFISCPLVEQVPVGIEHLTTLKQIGLAKMASNLEDELISHPWKAGHSPTVKSFADEFDMDSSTIRSFVDELDTAD